MRGPTIVDLQFTAETWSINVSPARVPHLIGSLTKKRSSCAQQTITVLGVPDDEDDGDISYSVDFTPLALVDASSGVVSLGAMDGWSGVRAASIDLINRDAARNRIGVLMSPNSACSSMTQENARCVTNIDLT